MNINRLSAYSLERNPQSGETLNIEEYSKFKYGHRPTALKFSYKMTEVFLQHFGVGYLTAHIDDLIVSTSPFWYAPPPANTIALRVHQQLNDVLMRYHTGPLKYIKIHRSAAPSCDFSKLSLEERAKNMEGDHLSTDTVAFRGKKVLLIEDARITGAHEQKTIAYMEHIGVAELTFLYVVDIAFGKTDPDIENRMNHIWVNGLGRLHPLMKHRTEYVLNARVCRYILSYEDEKALRRFLAKLSTEMLFDIYRYSLGDGYGMMEKYKKGFALLQQEIRTRSAYRNPVMQCIAFIVRRITNALALPRMRVKHAKQAYLSY